MWNKSTSECSGMKLILFVYSAICCLIFLISINLFIIIITIFVILLWYVLHLPSLISIAESIIALWVYYLQQKSRKIVGFDICCTMSSVLMPSPDPLKPMGVLPLPLMGCGHLWVRGGYSKPSASSLKREFQNTTILPRSLNCFTCWFESNQCHFLNLQTSTDWVKRRAESAWGFQPAMCHLGACFSTSASGATSHFMGTIHFLKKKKSSLSPPSFWKGEITRIWQGATAPQAAWWMKRPWPSGIKNWATELHFTRSKGELRRIIGHSMARLGQSVVRYPKWQPREGSGYKPNAVQSWVSQLRDQWQKHGPRATA